jgi:hypothetical protein
MFSKLVKSLWISGIFVITSSPIFAQNPLTATGVLRDDPNRPVYAISNDLAVTPDQFRACFSNVNPILHHTLDDITRSIATHTVIDSTTSQDHLRVVTKLFGFVSEIVGINANTVTANHTWAEG